MSSSIVVAMNLELRVRIKKTPSTLICQENYLLFHIEAGKPNPNEPSPEMGKPDCRSRAPLKGVTPRACWHYAIKLLHPSVGKYPSSDRKKERELDKNLSLRRKALEKVCLDLTELENEYPKSFGMSLSQLTNEVAIQQLKIFKLFSHNAPTKNRDMIHKISFYLEEFIKNDKNYANFREWFYSTKIESKRLKINLEFLAKHDISETYLIQQYYKFKIDNKHGINTGLFNLLKSVNADQDEKAVMGNLKKGIDTLLPPSMLKELWKVEKVSERTAWIDNYVFNFACNSYGMKAADWSPDKSVDFLLESLKQHGPHIVNGLIGQSCYTVAPKPLSEKINERTIWHWPKGSLVRTSGNGHSVLVIGARKITTTGRAFVYFIDPIDGSNPKNPEQQKIYVMSYEKFVEQVGSTNGVKVMESIKNTSKEFFCSHKFAYVDPSYLV